MARKFDVAWKQLTDPEGFSAPFGPTTAERRHPGFRLDRGGHECQWNGPSWPFATSVTLTALARLLHERESAAVGRPPRLLRNALLLHAKPLPAGRESHHPVDRRKSGSLYRGVAGPFDSAELGEGRNPERRPDPGTGQGLQPFDLRRSDHHRSVRNRSGSLRRDSRRAAAASGMLGLLSARRPPHTGARTRIAVRP